MFPAAYKEEVATAKDGVELAVTEDFTVEVAAGDGNQEVEIAVKKTYRPGVE